MMTTKVKVAVASTALAASAAGAQEPTPTPVALPAVHRVAPALASFTDNLLFGEVWNRSELSARDRSMVTISALIAAGKVPQIGAHVGLGLDNGLTPGEIGEIITHLGFYSGWPNAISAVNETDKVFDERGISAVQEPEGQPIELDPAGEAARSRVVEGQVGPIVPGLAEYTNRVLFGDLWRRPELEARDRSLVTMACLIAIGQSEQLGFHLNRAMDNGLTRSEAAEVVTHLAYYMGWPRAFSAVPVLREVFTSREDAEAAAGSSAEAADDTDLQVTPHAEAGDVAGDPEYFTGSVRIESFFHAEAPARTGGAMVHFSPGARTAWHTHPLGQSLVITSGCGWVQAEGRAVQAVRPGDVVWIPPHVRHWHGASASQAMSHLAVAEAQDGSVVTWMEHVTDSQYAQGEPCE